MTSHAMFAWVVTAVALASFNPAVGQERLGSGVTAPDIALDASIVRRMDEAGIVGVGAAIIVDKKVVWQRGYGFADRDRATPFTPETVMNVGSISKTIMGVAMMRAVQDGKLSLDEDVNTYLPFRVTNPHCPEEKITLRHLATHTSGITDRWVVYRDTYHFDDGVVLPLGEFLQDYLVPGGSRYARDNFLEFKPGAHREYSNIGAGLAGYVVEVAVGMTLNEYTKRQVFLPLGMNHTGWYLREVDLTKHATLYVSHLGLSIPIPNYQVTTYPDGGVRTSVSDLSKLFVALLNDGAFEGGRVLEPRWAEEMIRFQFSEAAKPANVDLQEVNSGLFWESKLNVTRMGHNGSDPGLRTWMLSNLTKDTAVILFSNTSLAGNEMRHHNEIFFELWRHAESLKAAAANPAH